MTVRLLLLVSLLFISGGESSNSNAALKRRSPQASSSSSGGGTPVDFDCPEEFGYYAHPSDCTQYYVCVFGGALLESCTGGLMYSHELQTCDWPRNVGCAPGSSASQQVQQIQAESPRQRQSSPPQRERIIQQQIPPKHDLYTEDDQLSPEELDSDRQQRVYRGQPQAIGQVQSDRDGLSTHSNAIPVPGRDKLSVVSYGTQQQYTSFDRHKPTGDVIQDKSDHNFLTNTTRRFRRQAQLRSHQDAYDTAPISWSSVQPRIVHHRRPQLIPHMFPSPQPVQHPHPSVSSLYPNRRPSYHRRPNEFKFEPNNAKYVKYQTTTHPPSDAALSTRPTHYAYHNQYKPSSAIETNYHHNVYMKQSTFRPSFGPPGYQTVPSNAIHYTTQRPREPSTPNPSVYKSQVTKPPTNYHTPTTTARKPTSYVYASNNMHQNSGLQLNQGSTMQEKPEDEGGGSKESESEEDDDYVEEEDKENNPSEQQRPLSKERSKESHESSERLKSTENASGTNSGEGFRPSFPDPPPNFYKDISASVSDDIPNPFANPDFDFNKFLDELREHHVQQTNGDLSTPSSFLYYEYPSSSSSKESNEYYYPKETTPKYFNKPPNHKYPEKESSELDHSRPLKESSETPEYNSEELNQQGQKPLLSEHTTSQYYYNTGKHTTKINPLIAEQTTPKYQSYSSEQPNYSTSPHYYQHSVSNGGGHSTKGQYGSSTYFTTAKPPDGIKSSEEYVDDFIGKLVKNSTYVRAPKPARVPKEPLRLQNIDNEGNDDDYEDDESDEYYDDDEEGDVEGDDEDYEDYDDPPKKSNQDASVSYEKSKEEARPSVTSSESSSASEGHVPSNTRYSHQTVKLSEHPTTQSHFTKHVSVQGGKCFSVRGKVKCLEPSSGPTASTALQNQPAVLYSNTNQFINPSYSSSTYTPPVHHNHRPRMRRPSSPLPLPSTESSLTPPPYKSTTYNSSRISPLLLSPSYSQSTEPVVGIQVSKQRQNRNKYELEDTDMRDKGHTQRALTRLRASVTPAQQQYVEQQTQQQTPPPRAYNQSRYVPSQYDPPLYSFYDDDVDIYKEIGDYAPYNTQGKTQYRTQYKEKAPQIEIVQQEPARPSYSKNKYNSQSDLYQSVTPQEYESYSIQTNDDLPYRQPQQTKSSTRSEVKESDDSRVSTASPGVEKATTSQQTVQQTASTTPPVTTSHEIKAEQLVSDGPFVIQIGRVANTPSPFKLPETESESPVNLLTRGHFVVREPEVVDITPKPNNRNRVEVPQRTISIRVPQAAIDSNKYSSEEAKQRVTPIRASESAEWNGFRVEGEVGSNHQEEASRRPSLRVPDSIKVREDYLRSRQGSKDETRRGPVRKPLGGRGSSRYQESTYELEDLDRDTQGEREENARPSGFRLNNDEEQKFAAEAERNARIQAQLRANDDAEYKRKQEELRRKALEEARAKQIEDAEKEAKEQVRQRQYEQARLRQLEEAERVAKELEERKEREEAQRKANEDARRRLIEEARRKQLEEARKKQIEEAQLKAREEYERKAKLEAARKAAQEEEERRLLEEEERMKKLIEARRAKEEADRRAAIEEAQRRAAVEEARRRAAAEEAQRRAAVEEAQRRAAAEESRRRAAAEEAQKRAAAEEARERAEAEEAQRRAAVQEAKRKSAEEARRKQQENLRQLEEGLSRRRGPQSRTQEDISFRPSFDDTERSRQRNSFRIVVDATEPSAIKRTSPFGDARPPKKYVSRNSTLINELYLNEQSTSFPDTMTPNSLSQTSPGRIYTENTRKTLDTPLPISQSDAEFSEKPVRVRPTSYDTQSTPGLTRGGSRHRGGQSYTISSNDAEPAPVSNRGTPAAPRVRPTLKPSNNVVGKASEAADIYKYPPRRPDNVYPTPQVDKTAAKCRKDVCLLPDCSCGGKEIPGDLTLEETPQIVLLTFDDSVNDLNKGLYEDLFERGRVNPNGCPISATFYVSHEWTDYSQVQNLYATGHEIASHSVSHSFGEQFSQKKWTKEIAGQREILAAYGGVRQEDIRGMRAPFLAIGGNKMFKMLYDSNFTYDSSMPVYENRPPSWPYTMDYKIFHDCMIPPCPTKSYPGVWEVPMVMWQDLNGGRCSMGDACSNPPDAEGVYKMLIKNFERHFTTNRAPFGLFYHAAWFTQPHHKEGFIAFLDTINKMPEVWVVTNTQAIQWVRDPTPINRVNSFAPFGCNYPERPKKCNNPKVCNLWHKSGVRYMRTCQPCPDVYPWTGKSGVRNSRVETEIINE